MLEWRVASGARREVDSHCIPPRARRAHRADVALGSRLNKNTIDTLYLLYMDIFVYDTYIYRAVIVRSPQSAVYETEVSHTYCPVSYLLTYALYYA